MADRAAWPRAHWQPPPALAQDAAAAESEVRRTVFIFNTLLFLIGGFLVMWMAAGFAMLEAGLVRSKNVSMQCLKNIALYSIAGLMFWVVGYNLMYPTLTAAISARRRHLSPWPDAGVGQRRR
jgi:Amt family ammonium transporter